jgi:hypothetical protein
MSSSIVQPATVPSVWRMSPPLQLGTVSMFALECDSETDRFLLCARDGSAKRHVEGAEQGATAMFYLPKTGAAIVVESNSDNVSAHSALWTFIGIASYLYPDRFPNGL